MSSGYIYHSTKDLDVTNNGNTAFSVTSINGTLHKLGLSKDNFVKFFIRTNLNNSNIPNSEREFINVEYNMDCSIIDENGVQESDTFAIITLTSNDKHLQEYFIEIFTMMLKKLPERPNNRDLALEIEDLASIFSALSNPPKKKIQGLWAELLVIERSKKPEILISAWHTAPKSKYDFTLGGDKIEVKSTSTETRSHNFSLDQLNPSGNSRLLIASTIVRESGKGTNGLSVKDLYNKICTRTQSTELNLQVMKVIIETLGSDLKDIDSMYFDYVAASDMLSFYDYKSIPKINKKDIPALVSKVKFTSNLDSIEPINLSEEEWGKSNLFNYI